jgi:glycosyltransferase involved in cell wall biosynthesis
VLVRLGDAAAFRKYRKYLRVLDPDERLDLVLRAKLACEDYDGLARLCSRLPESLAEKAERFVASAVNGLIDGRKFEPLDRLADVAARSRSTVLLRQAGLNFTHVGQRLTSASRRPPKRAAVVGWDLSHNPAGRAYVLYKLLEKEWRPELIGPIWQRFGRKLWPPLAGEGLTVNSFQPSDLCDVWREGAGIAHGKTYDLVIICKPRLPGLIIGLLIAEQSRCPIIIDIDENELAFEWRPTDDAAEELLARPFGPMGTRLAAENLHVADAITVASPVLQRQFPGHVVCHARDERSPLGNRASVRWQLGLTDNDFLLAFVGTAREHKGLGQVLAAMQEIANPAVKLLFAGSTSRDLDREIKSRGLDDQIIKHGEFSLSDLGGFLAAADLVPLLQDPDSLISQSQMPAKFTDALREGARVVATAVPPFRNMAERGVVDLISGSDFTEYLRKAISEPRDQQSCEHRRRIFAEEFSFAANRPRLEAAIKEAATHHASAASGVGAVLHKFLEKTRAARAANVGQVLKRRLSSSSKARRNIDIAFFWKQNDSGLFGRRSDMVVKYLSKTPRVGQVVHFDHPVSSRDVGHMIREKQRGRRNVAAMQVDNTLSRMLELADDPEMKRRVFVANEAPGGESFAGRPTRTPDQFADYIGDSLEAAGLDPAGTIAWVCPIVTGFADAAQKLRFRKIVVDLIDDQRHWATTEDAHTAMQAEYAATLRMADLVLTNSAGNRQRFASFRDDIVVIPNGAEIDILTGSEPVPESLRGLQRPIIGYVGNLRDRIDWPLVQALAGRRPSWTFVFAGPIEENLLPGGIRMRANVVFPGPIPYELSHNWMRAFDVAIIPHEPSGVTESMNPLKLYNYLAAGVPVVTTPVANIEDVADLVSVADSSDDFILAIEAKLASPRAIVPRDRLDTVSWRRRVEAMLDGLDSLL